MDGIYSRYGWGETHTEASDNDNNIIKYNIIIKYNLLVIKKATKIPKIAIKKHYKLIFSK
jgi:hypothetical protein